MPARALPVGVFADVGFGVLVFGAGFAAGSFYGLTSLNAPGLTALVLAAVAAGLARRRCAWALGLIWAAAVLQLADGTVVLGVELAMLVVGYGIGRHGRVVTVWWAGLSIPVGGVVAIAYVAWQPEAFDEIAAPVRLLQVSGPGITAAFLVTIAIPTVPYALGLLFRLDDRNRRVQAERDAAQVQAAAEHELAEVRARQTALARDVHDIVGHSLAVIIAQADSAHDAAGDSAVRDALAQIAAVGRSSLSEVRDVLSKTGQAGEGSDVPDLDELVRGVRSAGNTVHETSAGSARTLTPQAAAIAYRVLQELLTNCLKHGTPGGPIQLERTWTADSLVLRVANTVPDSASDPDSDIAAGPQSDSGPHPEPGEVGPGSGLAGARARLAPIGGTLRTSMDAATFTATACIPAACVPTPLVPGRA